MRALMVRQPMELAPVLYPQFKLDLSHNTRVLERLNDPDKPTPIFTIDKHNPLASCIYHLMEQSCLHKTAITQLGTHLMENLQQLQNFHGELMRQLLTSHENMQRAKHTLVEINEWQNTAMQEMNNRYNHTDALEKSTISYKRVCNSSKQT